MEIMEGKKDNQEKIHSEDWQEIISNPPSWLLKRGIGFVFFTLLIIVMISFIIKYPDTIKTTLKITAINAPKPILNLSAGVITKILVKDSTKVKKNEVLGYFESNTNHKEGLALLSVTTKLRQIIQQNQSLDNLIVPSLANLGELQVPYESLRFFYNTYIVTPHVQQFNALPQSKKSELLILLNDLIKELDNWKTQRVIISPISGMIVYSGLAEENQNIEANTNIFYVCPENSTYYGSMSIPQESIIKIKLGQEVHIKMRSFPYQEYGFIYGKVSNVSPFPLKDNFYITKVKLLKMPQNLHFKLTEGMLADVDVLVGNYSIIDRVWLNLKKSLL